MQVTKILMPIDFSKCSETALDYAILLAQQYGAELHWLHVVIVDDEAPFPEDVFPDFSEIHARLERVLQSEVGQRVSPPGAQSIRIVEQQRQALEAAPEILDYAETEGIDFIVIGTHGHRGLKRFLLGSVAETVVRGAPCPVLAVRGDGSAPDLRGIDRILVPYDFSQFSRNALEAARGLGETYGSHIDLLHVAAPAVPPGGIVGMPLPEPPHTDLTADAIRLLDQHAAAAGGPAVPSQSHVLEGSAAWRITDFAEEHGSDLIVMGSHGLSGLRRFLLGSVSEQVVRSAPCPVLVLRPPADSADETTE